MIRALASIAGITIQTAVLRLMSKTERAVKHLIDHIEQYKRRIIQEILITGLVAAVIFGWMAICQIIADSNVNWQKSTYGEIEICEGLIVEVIYLE